MASNESIYHKNAPVYKAPQPETTRTLWKEIFLRQETRDAARSPPMVLCRTCRSRSAKRRRRSQEDWPVVSAAHCAATARIGDPADGCMYFSVISDPTLRQVGSGRLLRPTLRSRVFLCSSRRVGVMSAKTRITAGSKEKIYERTDAAPQEIGKKN